VHHQAVGANRSDFRHPRIARHSRGLRRRRSICWVFSAVSAAHWRRERPKVSGREFPFPELLFAAGSSRVACRRLEPERSPLAWPSHRKVDKTLESKAARQASFDRALDEVRGEECERQGHPH
jgi:hypothetical protein